jgi:glycopeptide antibiotics resistance protein
MLVFLFAMAYKDKKARVIIFISTIIFSGIIELLQPRLTHGFRKCDIHDLAYNIVGCCIAVLLTFLMDYLISFTNKNYNQIHE